MFTVHKLSLCLHQLRSRNPRGTYDTREVTRNTGQDNMYKRDFHEITHGINRIHALGYTLHYRLDLLGKRRRIECQPTITTWRISTGSRNCSTYPLQRRWFVPSYLHCDRSIRHRRKLTEKTSSHFRIERVRILPHLTEIIPVQGSQT